MEALPNQMPWNGLGTDVTDQPSAEAIRKAAGLDWEVAQVPVFAGHLHTGMYLSGAKMKAVPNRNAIVRTDTGQPLGVSGNYFKPIQNHEADWLTQALMDAGLFAPIRSGEVHGGARTFHVGRVGDAWNVGGIDPMSTFFALWNRHDGRGSLTAAILTIRLSCSNQLPGVVAGLASGNTKRKKLFHWNVRHTTNHAQRLAVVQESIRAAGLAQETMKKTAETLLLRPFTTDDMVGLMEALFPTKDAKPRTLKTNLDRQAQVRQVWEEAENLEDVRLTAWGAWNAVAEYADHRIAFRATKVSTKSESRFMSITDPHGTANGLKVKAFTKIAQAVGVGAGAN